MKMNKIIMIFIVFLFSIIFLFSCSGRKANDSQLIYKVDFVDADGETILSSQQINKGEKAKEPEIPSKEGYTFDGWYYNDEKWSFIGYVVTSNMTLKAKYNPKRFNLRIDTNDSINCEIFVNYERYYEEHYFNCDELITLNVRLEEGYTFDGWYEGDNNISQELSYIFHMPPKDVAYSAHITPNESTQYTVNHYVQNLENNDYTLVETEKLYGTTGTMPSNILKNYDGFTGTFDSWFIKGDGTSIFNCHYDRNIYSVTLKRNIDNLNSSSFYYCENDDENPWVVNGNSIFFDKEKYTGSHDSYNGVSSPTFKYVFNYDGIFKFDAFLSSENNGTEAYLLVCRNGSIRSDYTITNNGKKEKQSINVFEGDVIEFKLSEGSSRYSGQYFGQSEAIINNIFFENNALNGGGKYKYGKEIEISTTTNPGYTFEGWYKDNKLYTMETSFNYKVGLSNDEFEARVTPNKYEILIDNQASGVTISGITSGNKYDYNSKIVLTASNVPNGYTIKWTRSDGKICLGFDCYEFNVLSNNLSIKVEKIIESQYKRNDKKIYFGTYPQTLIDEKVNASLVAELNDLARSGIWLSYDYHLRDYSIANYMYYMDIDYDNNGTYDYRGVYFTQYRPYDYSPSGVISSNSIQDENGYEINTIYWFSFDLIEWDILAEQNSNALVISNLILDCPDYSTEYYTNSYELSNIRKWLNDSFYNVAFNDLQQTIIDKTLVDNSISSTGFEENNYVCNDTNDYMFLLSYKEVNTYFSTSRLRQAKGSNYAKCQGLSIYSSPASWQGNSYWWSRSPGEQFDSLHNIQPNGGNRYSRFSSTWIGVRPACYIRL